jgi:chromate transport protein ChrA
MSSAKNNYPRIKLDETFTQSVQTRDKRVLADIATREAMKREEGENLRYATGRTWFLAIGFLWFLAPRIISIVIMIISWYRGIVSGYDVYEQILSTVLSASTFYSLFALVLIYKSNKQSVLMWLVGLSAVLNTTFAALSRSDSARLLFYSLIGFFHFLILILLWQLPLFKEYRLRSKELADQNKPTYERRKVEEWTKM